MVGRCDTTMNSRNMIELSFHLYFSFMFLEFILTHFFKIPTKME